MPVQDELQTPVKKRNEDEKFIAAFGRDKTFGNGMEGPLENCDRDLIEWFITGQALNKSNPQKLAGYSVVWRYQRGSKVDPIRGYVAAFFPQSDQAGPVGKKSGEAALLVQLFLEGDKPKWRIRFPNEANTALAYTKLVDHILKRRLKANAGPH